MTDEKTYRVNEIVYSIQGEGLRTGIPTAFLRFSGCNLRCSFCDTNHAPHERLTLEEIIYRLAQFPARAVSLCGGEPTLQIDTALIMALKRAGYYTTIETNGTKKVHPAVDWVVVSPKVDNDTLVKNFRFTTIDEIKYVLKAGDPLPDPPIAFLVIKNKLLSPIFDGDRPVKENIDYVVKTVMENPAWRMTYQNHKFWGVI